MGEKTADQITTELRQALMHQEQLMALVAHDIRGPLSAIIGFVKLMRDCPLPQAEQDAIFDKVLGAAKQIDKMVVDLLEGHRIRSGKLQPNISSFAAHEFIHRILEERSLAAQAEQKGVRLVCNLDVVTLKGDETLLSSVVQNLVSNAIKFCHAGQQVALSVRKCGLCVQIVVEDTGVGMDQEKIKKIFAFHEPTSTNGTNGERGNGFGLPLCQEIVRAHKGHIKVASEQGKGTAFTVVLPS